MRGDLEYITKGSIISFCGKIIGIFLAYMFSVAIARLLGPAIMGTFYLGLTIINILSVFCICGLNNGLLRYVSIYNADGRYPYIKGAILKSSYFTILLSIIVGCLLFIFSRYISNSLFSNPSLSDVLRIFVLLLPIFCLWKIYLEVLRGFKAIAHIVFNQDILLHLLSLCSLGCFYLLFKKDVISVSWAYAFSVSFVFIIVIFSLYKVFPSFKMVSAKDEFRDILSYSMPIFLIGVVSLFLFWIDTIMLGILRTPNDVGVYTAAAKTAAFVAFFLLSINSIIPPFFVEYYSKDLINELGKIARTSARWIFYCSLPVAILFILVRREIMGIYGRDFILGIWALSFLCIGQLVNASAGSVGYILMMTGHQRDLAKIIALSAVLNILLNSVFIPVWGISGAGLATAISISILNILMALSVYKNIGIKAYTDRIAIMGVIAALGVIVFWLFKIFINLYFGIVSFFIVYIIFLYLWGLKKEDREFLILMKRNLLEGKIGSQFVL